MCGIAGTYNCYGLPEGYAELTKAMTDSISHRGPDDSDFFTSKNCTFGHRRLAIIDLSSDGRQPFVSEDGRYQLIFNGEIYNYIELKKELENKGVIFTTKTDTEVLFKAYLHYGKDCLNKFNGMFAFAIYDSKDNELFIARDRIGIKPLYYRQVKDTILFASETKALTLAEEELSANYQSIFDFVAFSRTDVFDETFYNEIKRLPTGHYLVANKKGMKIKQWWNPEDYLDRLPGLKQAEILEQIEEIMFSSVKFRMRSDVRVGSCLSGGLDSSILLGMLFEKNLAQKDYPTFTASFPNHPIDEIEYVDKLNERFPFQSYRTYPTSEMAADKLEEFVYYSDEPTTSPSFFSQYMVMQKAKEEKVTVLLDGQGGDESFAGYQYFHGFHLYGLLKSYNIFGFSNELIRSLLRKQHKSAYQTLLFQVLPRNLKKKFLKKVLPYIDDEFFNKYIDNSKIFNEFFDASNLNQSLLRHFQYKLEHLLRCEDRNSMAFSLEARVPYLDHRLVEFVLGISGKLKIKKGETKFLQKQALKQYTIPKILDRTDKIGFGTPVEDWMYNQYWTNLTKENFQFVDQKFQGVFKNSSIVPSKPFDRWKINQLATWQKIFLSGTVNKTQTFKKTVNL